MWEAIMEMAEFGMDQGHIHRDNKCLSKAGRLANVGYETLCNQIFWSRKSPSHGDKHKKKKRKKDLKQQVTRKNSLRGAKLYKF